MFQKGRCSTLKTIGFYQLKGGVGKTASAVNIAYLAAQEGIRTLLWDLDPQAAAAWYLPEVECNSSLSVSDVIKRKKKLSPLIKSSKYEYLDILPADMSLRHADALLDKPKAQDFLSRMISALSEEYRLLVIDCAPSISVLAEQVFETADNLYLPTIPSHLSLNSYEKVLAFFKQQELAKKKVHVFYSMVDRRKKMHCDFLEMPPVKSRRMMESYIPYSAEVEKMGAYRAPLNSFSPSSAAGIAYLELWTEIKAQNKL